ARPAPDPVKRPVKDEEPPPNEELPVVVTAPTAAEGPPTSGIAGALKNKEELDALRALVSSTDVLLLARALSRAEKLPEDADATSLRAQLAEQLARVSEVHRELEVEEEVAKALGPLRRGQPNGFEAARQACTHTIARLDSRVAVEMTDAANLSEELLARARKGLAVDATEPVLLKNKMSFTGASTPSGDLWKAGNVYFSFPGDVSIEGLRVLASRTERSLPQLARAAAGWALLSNDLNDARKRLIAVARAEKKPVFERLEEVLRNRERNLRLPVLAHADLAWGAGQRSSAMQLYHRLCTTPPDVLAPDDRQRALERAGLVKPAPTTVAAPAGKRAWDFTKIKERTDGLPADWTRASAVSLDAFPGRPRAAARLETFDSEQTPEGLELTGVGRIVSSPTWTQSELQIDVEANLSETMGLGITLGDYAEAGDTVWTIAGYGIRFAPRGRLARFDPQAFFARQDGLWVTTTGLPQITPLKNVEPKAPEDERGGKVALRLTATRKDGKLRLVFARLVDAKPQTIAEGTLTEHLPAARTPLRAGLVVTGWGDQETVVVERFSVTPR
ncbi:MAG: hypothetical protein ACAI25_12570, partial [Planctomycetota bacterium]